MSLVQRRVMEGGVCQAFGFGTVYAMNLPAFWVTACAFFLWTRIIHNRTLDAGARDWRLHAACWGLPLLWGLVPFLTRDYGPEPMWCGLVRVCVLSPER